MNVIRLVSPAVVAGAFLGLSVFGGAASASADPGCDVFGWTHPMCAGGAWDESASQEWGPDASTRAGLNAVQEPAMVPNTDGGLSTPGSPGAI
jgi:hypothetical protein